MTKAVILALLRLAFPAADQAWLEVAAEALTDLGLYATDPVAFSVELNLVIAGLRAKIDTKIKDVLS